MLKKMKLEKLVPVLLSMLLVMMNMPVALSADVIPVADKTQTTITWDNPTEYYLGPLSSYDLEVTLKDADGNPLANRTIKWEADNGTHFVNQTTTTDANGASINEIKIGHSNRNLNYTAQITVEYEGDDVYGYSRREIILNCYDNADPTPAPSPSVVPVPTGTCVSGYISTGMNGDTSLLNGFQVRLEGSEVAIAPESCRTVTKRNDSTGKDGFFTMGVPYYYGNVVISKKGYLKRSVTTRYLAPGASGTPVIEIYEGDINEDGSINMKDIVLMAAAFNTTKGTEKYNEVCDYNNDNAINLNDIVIVSKHFNSTSLDYTSL